MRVRQLLQQKNQALEWLMLAVTGWTRAELLLNQDVSLSAEQLARFLAYRQRLQQGEPLAYILGHQPFWSLDFLVSPDCLIPRPETESLIEWILQQFSAETRLHVADLGAGSGAIAVSLAYERPNWLIDAVDISVAALSLVGKNADRYKLQNLQTYLGSWCDALPTQKHYDLIVSNPPYIAPGDLHLRDLRFEPQMALVSADNGLADLQKIIIGARTHLMPQGYLVLEHGYTQAQDVQAACAAAGYVSIESHIDLLKHPRFVSAVWPGA